MESPVHVYVVRSPWTVQGLRTLWLSVQTGLLSILSLYLDGDTNPSTICKSPLRWKISGQALMQEHKGNIVVVALLQAS
ncbi:selenoprotein Pb-like [Arapaima gigas]